MAGLEARACLHRLCRAVPFAVLDDLAVHADEAARDSARLKPVGPALAQQEAGLRRDIGVETAGAGRRHLLPARIARAAGRGVDEVRAARCRPARCESARNHPNRAAGRERDVQRPVHR